jgi:hypothetical protein
LPESTPQQTSDFLSIAELTLSSKGPLLPMPEINLNLIKAQKKSFDFHLQVMQP